jgi:hypothetical protein
VSQFAGKATLHRERRAALELVTARFHGEHPPSRVVPVGTAGNILETKGGNWRRNPSPLRHGFGQNTLESPQVATHDERRSSLAMQKVVGSNPLIRSPKIPVNRGLLFWIETTSVPDESQRWTPNCVPGAR